MSERYISLYNEDAEQLEELRERLDEELPGGVDSYTGTVRAALDLAEEALDTRD